MKPVVWLWNCPGVSLVLNAPTGVLYSNQTCGNCCMQPTVEGILIPLGPEFMDAQGLSFDPEDVLFSYFTGPKYSGSGAMTGIDSDDADFIDALFVRARISRFLKVDRHRLADSHEAWVCVEVLEDAGEGVFTGAGPFPRPAIISWCNSD